MLRGYHQTDSIRLRVHRRHPPFPLFHLRHLQCRRRDRRSLQYPKDKIPTSAADSLGVASQAREFADSAVAVDDYVIAAANVECIFGSSQVPTDALTDFHTTAL